MYAAILFDLDNTLIDRDAAFRVLIRATFPSCGEVRDELRELDNHGYGNRHQLLARWQQLGGGTVEPDMLGVLTAKYVRRQDDLLQALSFLAGMTELAIVTNGGAAAQVAKWHAAGIDEVIPRQRLFISDEIGIKKPDPAIFDHACEVMSVRPNDCLYIGDQYDIDIVGARAAGMSTMLAETPLSAKHMIGLRSQAGSLRHGCES